MDLLRRVDTAGNDQRAFAQSLPCGAHEIERVCFRCPVREQIDAAAAEGACRASVIGDQRGGAEQSRRMTNRAARKRKVPGEITEDSLRRRKIGAAEDPIDAECAPDFQRLDDRLRCCTYNLQVTDPATPPDLRDELAHRRGRHADVLEADVSHAQIASSVDDGVGILDRAIVAGQHEDEIHGRLPSRYPWRGRRPSMLLH
jgi:hypothetical protein